MWNNNAGKNINTIIKKSARKKERKEKYNKNQGIAAVIGNGICAFIFGGFVVVVVVARYRRNSVFLLVNI